MKHPHALACAVPALLATALATAPAAADGKNPPDPPAATWNDPPPPGVTVARPAAPSWCAGYKPRPWLPGSLAYDDVRHGYTETALEEVAQLACDRPGDPGRQAWIAFYRQGWLNIVGTTDADDRDALAARMHLRDAERVVTEQVCKPLYRRDERRPADRAFDRLRADALGCGGLPFEIRATGDDAAISFWLDGAAEPPDELVRVGWVLHCLQTGASSVDPASVHVALGNYAYCGHDALKLDRAGFERDLAVRRLPPLARARAHEVFGYTKKLVASYEQALAALAQQDPDYGHLAHEVPAQAFAAWVKTRAANAAAFDAAAAVEDQLRGGNRKEVAGCGPTLRKLLQAHVAAVGPKTVDEIRDAATDDVGTPLLRALITCDAFEERYGLVDAEVKLEGAGRVHRGPRTAAFWAAMDRVTEIVKDKTKFLAQPARFGAPLPRLELEANPIHVAYEATFNKAHLDRGAKGTVAAVKPQGDGVMVSFRTESWQEPILDCHDTNRVDRILADGRLEYRQSCVSRGTRTAHSTLRPVWMPRDLAAGLKAGVVMSLQIDDTPSPPQGFPLEVYADAGKKHLVQYAGFPVGK
jgi:hypothetical protein